MKSLILLWSAAVSLLAVDPPALLSHPFRLIGEKHCDLRPLFSWYAAPDARFAGPNPMPVWRLISIRVMDCDERGVLGRESDASDVIHIAHYPLKKIVEGARIYCFAVENGTHDYVDVRGANHTIRSFDYGVPFQPSLTNFPAAVHSNTVAKTTTPAR